MLATLQGEEESLIANSRRDINNEHAPSSLTAGGSAGLRQREREFQRLVQDVEREQQPSSESTSQPEPSDSALQHPDWAIIGRSGPRHYSAWDREHWLSEVRTGSLRTRTVSYKILGCSPKNPNSNGLDSLIYKPLHRHCTTTLHAPRPPTHIVRIMAGSHGSPRRSACAFGALIRQSMRDRLPGSGGMATVLANTMG